MLNLVENIQCSFLPGKFNPFEKTPELYNKAYHSWKNTWGKIFSDAGSPDSLNVENFLRQNVVVTLHHRNEVIGLVTATFFNLTSDVSVQHPYLKPFPSKMTTLLTESKSGMYMTGEYLAVHPDYRKSKLGVSLSEVLIGLIQKIFTLSQAQILFGTAVRPKKVHESCFGYGYQECGAFEKYGLDCVLLFNTQANVREHENPEIRDLINFFWNHRSDFTILKTLPQFDENHFIETQTAA